ncbi:hypothetical protein LOTGIDRAFT_238985 [Lottia gigantea]|uniref:Uncharacterized protein n=1 Tax=Lottia gigantea TaxID=225164 RepID=V4A3Y7_LOTGI|nr:hypothetical protein LOTGIDRAFT_238985 [Lottia gigantea]ESO98623.1 hypothetical protein LOTGIDRAFT_238985 [Lottia gigantea]
MGRKSESRYKPKSQEREKRRARRKQDRRCRDIRIGGCIFVLGFPLLLAGTIILIVTNVNKNQQSLPSSLFLLGPLFTGLSLLCFILGLLLTEIINIEPLIYRIIPDNPKTCPFLYNLFKKDNQQYIDQQTAIISQQLPPSKSALRKPPNPESQPPTKVRRGVTFSETSSGSEEKYSSQISLVSLRNCKIHPSFEEDEGGSKTQTDTVYIVSPSTLPIADSNQTNDDEVFHSNEDVV